MMISPCPMAHASLNAPMRSASIKMIVLMFLPVFISLMLIRFIRKNRRSPDHDLLPVSQVEAFLRRLAAEMSTVEGVPC